MPFPHLVSNYVFALQIVPYLSPLTVHSTCVTLPIADFLVYPPLFFVLHVILQSVRFPFSPSPLVHLRRPARPLFWIAQDTENRRNGLSEEVICQPTVDSQQSIQPQPSQFVTRCQATGSVLHIDKMPCTIRTYLHPPLATQYTTMDNVLDAIDVRIQYIHDLAWLCWR